MKVKIIFLLLFALLVSCQKSTEHKYSFYYWKSHFKLDEKEKEALQKASLDTLYIRFFDIDKEEQKVEILAPISGNAHLLDAEKQFVPTVFITNRAFFNISKEEIAQMAQVTFDNILRIQKSLGLKERAFAEIQIDCDWIETTREDFFLFLKELKKVSSKKVSSTLRLNQVKYKKKMGIPPVDKVYLMCYSTSSPLDNDGKNSILEVDLLKNYLASLDQYPIKNIDVALPIYSWGIVTNHVGKHKLINALNISDLSNDKFKKISDTEAVILEDGFYFGYFLNKGFIVRVEEISEEQLTEVKTFLDQKLKHYHIIYYHLDSQFIKNRKL
ncbi:hypothetical protein OKE80_08110 [Riemerella anatipestifer]|uniref:Lipoprotein n=1 Tax=Riemerella anatipestifer TaxID=34085 RepID=A0AAP3AQ41_RIEAN|nr:hypothetical protein [Riemerella anatipestifer]MBT0574283.1 hypothetical protein [Riemerella anatipestifer]MCO7319272.1 hypothetical protein [Riemerella anatipestifer]MCQ4155550.1 hypothetical protein [Riemerella anatipestifer]MCQ4181500.1 hypothetical protein [Riemerella anatipestifer]MCT6764643.1 hypothetical protein [Riemerella anatipestifer]